MNEFSQYIKIIGRGKRAGRYLSQSEAYEAFTLLLSGQAEPEQIGAFLMLLRVREESAEELAGFVQASRNFNSPALTQLQPDLDLGCYAGKRRHLPWFVLSVICLAQQGKAVFLHGTKEPDSNRLYLPQVFQQLGLPIASDEESAKHQLSKYGFVYCDLPICNPQLEKLIQMRSLFALRSPANTLARMLNPSQAEHSFHGVFHKHFDQRHVETARLMGDNKVSCIRGEGGEVEVNPERPFEHYQLRHSEIHQLSYPALLENWQIKPRELNIEELEQLWTGQSDSSYGEAAVVGTLANYLALIGDMDVNQSLNQAKSIWQDRDKQPFSILFS